VRAYIVMEENHTTAKNSGTISASVEERKSSDFIAMSVSIAGHHVELLQLCYFCACAASHTIVTLEPSVVHINSV
jgi:hypothetical protein